MNRKSLSQMEMKVVFVQRGECLLVLDRNGRTDGRRAKWDQSLASSAKIARKINSFWSSRVHEIVPELALNSQIGFWRSLLLEICTNPSELRDTHYVFYLKCEISLFDLPWLSRLLHQDRHLTERWSREVQRGRGRQKVGLMYIMWRTGALPSVSLTWHRLVHSDLNPACSPLSDAAQ